MKRFLPLLAICLTVACAAATSHIAQRLLESRVVEILSPAMNDSLDAKGNKFSNASLLNTKGKIKMEMLDLHLVETDTAGIISIPDGDGKTVMRFFRTRIRPEKYVAGKLSVTSPARFEVLLDDASLDKKTTLEDSITRDSSKSFDLSFEPSETRYITVKILTEPDSKNVTLKTEFIPDEGFEDVVVTLDPDAQERFNIDTTEDGTRVAGISISPDGKYLLMNYSHKYSKSKTRRWADIKETASGKVIASRLESGLRWMPKGHTLYYTQPTKTGFDVFTLAVPSLDREVIINDIPDRTFVWSPTGDYILYYDEVEGKADDGPLHRIKSPDDRIPGNRDRSVLLKYDIASGIASPVIYDKESPTILDITKDGRKLLYSVTVATPDEYPFYTSALMQLDLASMKTDTIFASEPYLKNAVYSPDGKQLFLEGGPAMLDGIGQEKNGHPIPNDYDVQGYIYDIASRSARAATLDFNPSLDENAVWNCADNRIYFRAEKGFGMNMYSLDPVSLKITELPQEVKYCHIMSVGEDESKWIAYTGLGFEDTGAAYLLNLKTLKSTLLDDPMKETMSKLQLGKVEPWNFTSSDSTEIEGYITYPPGYDPSQKYPMIVYYYGGTSPTYAGMTSPYSVQLFASRGYIVYTLNPSGTTGYGQEFSARHVNAWGKYTANDIIEGVTKICEAHPSINKDKIGCIGASYGGFMTQYLLTKTDIFAAAVSHAGISSVSSYWGEGYWGYSYNSVAAAKSYPWTDKELFTQGSLFNADKIHTPLLLLHGTSDTNVPIGESIQIFNALKILGRDVEMITVDGQDHFISDFEKRKLWHATIMAWFAKWLQDDPRWWDSLYD